MGGCSFSRQRTSSDASIWTSFNNVHPQFQKFQGAVAFFSRKKVSHGDTSQKPYWPRERVLTLMVPKKLSSGGETIFDAAAELSPALDLAADLTRLAENLLFA